MLKKSIQSILFNRPAPFITVATSDKAGMPNAAPKLIFKYSRGYLYLVDVPHGQTWSNLMSNPQLALSFVDLESLKAYRLKGDVTVLEDEKYRQKFRQDIDKRLNDMIVNRIMQGVGRGYGHKNFMANVPKDFIIFKVKIVEIVEYGLEDIKTRKSTRKKIKI